jgi:hypothetical protein
MRLADVSKHLFFLQEQNMYLEIYDPIELALNLSRNSIVLN